MATRKPHAGSKDAGPGRAARSRLPAASTATATAAPFSVPALPASTPVPPVRRLVFVLGDQLDRRSAAFDDFDPAHDALFMAEAIEEQCAKTFARYRVHVWRKTDQKTVALFKGTVFRTGKAWFSETTD